jgi:hypothetical protein
MRSVSSDLDRPEPHSRQQHSSFVIRVWREGAEPPFPVDAAGGGGLRGSVQVVGRESVRYFASLEDMTEIIAETVGLPGDED